MTLVPPAPSRQTRLPEFAEAKLQVCRWIRRGQRTPERDLVARFERSRGYVHAGEEARDRPGEGGRALGGGVEVAEEAAHLGGKDEGKCNFAQIKLFLLLDNIFFADHYEYLEALPENRSPKVR